MKISILAPFLSLASCAVADASGLAKPLMEAVCEGRSNLVSLSVGGSPRATCLSCPSYTGRPRDDRMKIGEVHAGHFSSADADERLIEIEDCESDTYGSAGTVLIRKRKTSWERVTYAPGKRPLDCVPFKMPSGQDVLVCQSTSSDSDQYYRSVDIWAVEGNALTVRELVKPIAGIGESRSRKGECFAVEIEAPRKRAPASLAITVIGSRQRVPAGTTCPERGTEEKTLVLEAQASEKGLKLTSQSAKELKALRKYLDPAKGK